MVKMACTLTMNIIFVRHTTEHPAPVSDAKHQCEIGEVSMRGVFDDHVDGVLSHRFLGLFIEIEDLDSGSGRPAIRKPVP